MKKLIALQVLMMTVLIVNAQSGLKWQKIDSFKEKYNFEYFIRTGNNTYDAVFTIPHNKPFQATQHNIFIRSYDKNMVQVSERGIPAESPRTLYIAGFRNFNVLAGNMDEGKNPFSKFSKDEKVLIADENMNPLTESTFPLHGKRNYFDGLPTLYASPDSSFLIVVASEVLPGKPMKQPPMIYYVNVYDKSMKMVWTDSIKTEQVFGEDVVLNNVSFSFIENKLLFACSIDKKGFSKTPAQLFLLEYEKPQSYKMVLKEDFPIDLISFQVVYNTNGMVYLSGTNHQNTNEGGVMGLPGMTKRKLFYIKVDIKNGSAPVIKNYDIDKDFTAKYPDYKLQLMESFRYPTQLLVINDNLYYISEHRYSSTTTTRSASGSTSSTTTYYFKAITIIKFDENGGIQWLKMIPRTVETGGIYAQGICKAFRTGNDICLFYYDYLENVTSGRNIPRLISSDLKLWLAKAMISSDGEIHSRVVSNIGDDKVATEIPNMIQLGDTRFLVIGRRYIGINAAFDVYYSFYDLD